MDSAVTAALITTPTAVLAAAAAYAAGRVQGRGSVDAVRRKDQRDAYAELLAAAKRFYADAGSRLEGHLARRRDGGQPDSGQVAQVRREGRSPAQDAVMMAAGAVLLEGPDSVASHALVIENQAEAIDLCIGDYLDALATGEEGSALDEMEEDFPSEFLVFTAALHQFTLAASVHLNGEESARNSAERRAEDWQRIRAELWARDDRRRYPRNG